MRQPWEWTETDLQRLVRDKVPESLELEYKQCKALRNDEGKKLDISKDVSAMANSAGGVIIYGIVEENNLPSRLDDGCDVTEISREWLEQVINSKIKRRVNGIRINPVPVSTSGTGRCAYVVSVPQSVDAPHQAADHKFYKRHNFQIVPMEEYEIRDVARRMSAPSLTLKFEPSLTGNGDPSGTIVALQALVENLSDAPAEYMIVQIFIDSRLTIMEIPGGDSGHDIRPVVFGGQEHVVAAYSWNRAIPHAMPIFSGMQFKLFEKPFKIVLPDSKQYFVGWMIASPHMGKRTGSCHISSDGKNVNLFE